MHIENKIREEIRDIWFKDHIAKYTIINENLKILEWSRPNSSEMSIRYVLDNEYVYITGDLYSAIFRLTEPADLERLGVYSEYYFFYKLKTMEKDKFKFNSNLAVKELKEKFKYICDDIDLVEDEEDEDETEEQILDYQYQEYKEIFRSLIKEAKSTTSQVEWISYICRNSKELEEADIDYYEWAYDIGEEPSEYLIAYLIGLKMAYEQLFHKC